MKSMRILFIAFNMPWRGGGTFYRAFGFAKHLVQRGHKLTILTTSLNQKWHWEFQQKDGVELALAPSVFTGKLRSGWDPYESVRRLMWVYKHPFDLIHGFESRPLVIFPALYAQKKYKAPLVLDWADWFGRGGSVEERSPLIRWGLRPIETYFEEHFRTRAQGSTVINHPLQERLSKLGVSPKTIIWLPNGAETELILPTPRQVARRRLNLPEDAVLIGHLGQAFPRDANLMAKAFNIVYANCQNAKLVLIGNHKTNIAEFVFKMLTEQDKNPSNAIIETGFISNQSLNDYLAACDLLWLPLTNTLANKARWPMKINDYMSSGRATVSTNVGDLVQLFEGRHPIGLLARPESNDFAQKTLSLLADSMKRIACEQNARNKVETQFAWQLVTTQLEKFYEQIL